MHMVAIDSPGYLDGQLQIGQDKMMIGNLDPQHDGVAILLGLNRNFRTDVQAVGDNPTADARPP
jgi:hypothetical protein